MLVLDSRAFGGQAGASSRIENYLGFPTGISGVALAGRAFNQAQKFGAVMAIPPKCADSNAASTATSRGPIPKLHSNRRRRVVFTSPSMTAP